MPMDFDELDSYVDDVFIRQRCMQPMGVGPRMPGDYRKRYGQVYPEAVFRMWERFGFDGFFEGRWWFADAPVWQPAVEAWLEGLDLPYQDTYHCLAYNALGMMALWGQHTWTSVFVNPTIWTVSALLDLPDRSDDYEYQNSALLEMILPSPVPHDSLGQVTSEVCPQKYGPLQPGQIYGTLWPQLLLPKEFYCSLLRPVEAVPFLVENADVKPRELEILKPPS